MTTSRLAASVWGLVVAACSAPQPSASPCTAARASPTGITEVRATPLTECSSRGYVLVLEHIECQGRPGRFMTEPASDLMATGDALSRWPIYGSIVLAPKWRMRGRIERP